MYIIYIIYYIYIYISNKYFISYILLEYIIKTYYSYITYIINNNNNNNIYIYNIYVRYRVSSNNLKFSYHNFLACDD